MKSKALQLLCLAAMLAGLEAPASGQSFPNGGFEQNSFANWQLSYATNTNGTPTGWTSIQPGGHPTPMIVNANSQAPGVGGADINPFEGTYMARINDGGGGRHATRLSQSTILTAADLFNGGQISFRWGAALQDPGSHSNSQLPFVQVRFLVNGQAVQEVFFRSNDNNGWLQLVSAPFWPVYYRQDAWSIDLCTQSVGDFVEFEVIVADCSLGCHFGYAFIDDLKVTSLCAPNYGAIFLAAPNAFTPNGDGLNDWWGFRSFYATRYEVNIWNRWGNNKVLLRQTTGTIPHWKNGDFIPIWDGTVGGIGFPFSSVVVYELKLFNCDDSTSKQGIIAIIL